MKILGLIADTHIPSRRKSLPKQVFKAFENVDMIIHAGDFEALSVAVTLEKIAPLIAVRGNMCKLEVQERYPEIRTLDVEDMKIGVTHGDGRSNGFLERVAAKFYEKEVDIIVCGHTHQPNVEKHQDLLFINPGSPTDKVFARRNTVALLKINGKLFDYDFIEIV